MNAITVNGFWNQRRQISDRMADTTLFRCRSNRDDFAQVTQLLTKCRQSRGMNAIIIR